MWLFPADAILFLVALECVRGHWEGTSVQALAAGDGVSASLKVLAFVEAEVEAPLNVYGHCRTTSCFTRAQRCLGAAYLSHQLSLGAKRSWCWPLDPHGRSVTRPPWGSTTTLPPVAVGMPMVGSGHFWARRSLRRSDGATRLGLMSPLAPWRLHCRHFWGHFSALWTLRLPLPCFALLTNVGAFQDKLGTFGQVQDLSG